MQLQRPIRTDDDDDDDQWRRPTRSVWGPSRLSQPPVVIIRYILIEVVASIGCEPFLEPLLHP